MRRTAARHARRSSATALRARPAPALLGLAALTAAALVGPAASGGSAAVAAECLAPQVSDVMVNQGVASYDQLARGKTTLVKYFLRLPNCAPSGASVQITGGTLFVSSGDQTQLQAALPLPPIGVATTAPIPSAGSDPLFVVDGEDVQPDASGRIAFIAELEYAATAPDTDPVADKVTVTSVPGTSTPVSALLAPAVRPLRVLVVPMGDAGTSRRPTDYRTQFPLAAEEGVQRGMTSLSRQLPVPDSQGENLLATNAGLRYSLNSGLLQLGEHLEDGVVRNYMSTGKFCGNDINSTYVGAELQRLRTAWNSVNDRAQADYALGQIWQDISRGQSTEPGANCADGYAHINAKQAWGRVVTANAERPDVTGAISTMELVHNMGQVPPSDSRFEPGFHSKNDEADVTAPDRAWNILERSWIADDRSAMKYAIGGWHGSNTLLEKEDWARTQCVLVNGGTASSTCGVFGGIGTSAAGGATDAGSFFVSGQTDGTPGGTDAHTYRTEGELYDEPVEPSEFRFVQRDALGGVVKDTGFAVGTSSDNHHAPGGSGPPGHLHDGVFGTQLPADARTAKIQIWKGAPGASGSVLLYERVQNAAPSFVSVSAAGSTLSVSAADETPADLRLDLFLSCPEQTSPLAVALRPSAIVGTTAAFVTSYDTSLGCPQGQLLVRVTDGVTTSSQEGPTPALAVGDGAAAIYAPTAGDAITQFEPVALSGSGRDALDRPADKLVWSLQGPSYPVPTVVAEGATAQVTSQDGLEPGDYTLQLRALTSDDVLLATTTSSLTVLQDQDRDRIPDQSDKLCDGTGAELDPTNATSDSDRDGAADVVDDAACVSSSTLAVRFRPDSLRTSASGVPVTVTISSAQVDLTELAVGDLFITQVAGFPTRIPALSYRQVTPGEAELKFDRDALSSLLISQDLIGYVPIFVGTLDKKARGADPDFPLVFP